ncbi:MAG TPA: Spy/CpxP family protein refolding chaperone [Methylomirabilota bacterium]|nr:Spy/CpxP family protein refolding chaperone [Methylomirabilota bacterium]
MNARTALGGLALALGMTLPVSAEPLTDTTLAQAPADAPRPAPGPGAHPYWGQRPEGHGGHHGRQHRARAHRFSLSGLALRHQRELALTPAQVQSLRQLGTDAQRDAIKRGAEQRLAEVDLRTLTAPDPADPGKPRDLARIEAKVREIEKLRADARIARIRGLEQSRQVLTPEQREKLRGLLSQPHRGPHGPGVRGMSPEDGGQKPAAAEESAPTAG